MIRVMGFTRWMGHRATTNWVVEQFGRFGITVEQAAKPKSDLYVDLLALLNSKRVEFLIRQLKRRHARSGSPFADVGAQLLWGATAHAPVAREPGPTV